MKSQIISLLPTQSDIKTAQFWAAQKGIDFRITPDGQLLYSYDEEPDFEFNFYTSFHDFCSWLTSEPINPDPKAVKYVRPNGGNVVARYGEDFYFVLVGHHQPYQPQGGKRLLKSMVEGAENIEGRCYRWKRMSVETVKN